MLEDGVSTALIAPHQPRARTAWRNLSLAPLIVKGILISAPSEGIQQPAASRRNGLCIFRFTIGHPLLQSTVFHHSNSIPDR